MRVVFICLQLVLACSRCGYAQKEARIDSLQRILATMKEDTMKVKLLRFLFKEYEFNDSQQAERIAHEELRISQATRYEYGKATAYRHLGNIKSASGKGADAIAYHIKALKIYEQLGKAFFVAACYNNIGDVYRSRNETSKAELHFEKAIQIWTPLKGGQEGVAIALAGLGEIYLSHNDLPAAKRFYKRALVLAVESDIKHLQCESSARLASIAIMDQEMASARRLLAEAKRLALNIHAGDVLMMVHHSYAELHITQENYETALSEAQSAFAYAVRIASAEWKIKCLDQLVRIAKAMNAYRAVSNYQTLYIQLSDSMHNVDQSIAIENLQYDYLLKKKEMENGALIKEHEADLNMQRLRWRIGGVAFLVILGIALFYRRHASQQKKLVKLLELQKQEIEKQAAEIQARNEEILHQYGQIKNQNENLFTLNEALNKLFSVISHDLRGPFKTIEGVMSLFIKNLLNSSELAELSTKLMDIVTQTGGLLDNLLLWSKTQMHGTQVKREAFALHELLNECIQVAMPQAEQKCVSIVLENSVQANVMADYDMVAVIVRNLLSNAIKFSPPHTAIYIGFVVAPPWSYVMVMDRGAGISNEVKEKLFDRNHFYSSPGTANEKGTGIGLNLCQEYVHLNGGAIRVESELGKGSVFEFTLPLA